MAWYNNMVAVSLLLKTNMAALTSHENETNRGAPMPVYFVTTVGGPCLEVADHG